MSVAFVAAVAGWTVGCGELAPDPSGAGEGDVATVTSAITTTDFTDASGTILTRVKTCDYASSQPSGSVHNACAYCIVDVGWARVGGGAEILGEASPGAQLIVTRPDGIGVDRPTGCLTGEPPSPFGNDIWVARSRGIVAHQLRAYVVGMKIRDVNGATVAPEVTSPVDRVTANVSPPANASIVVDSAAIQGSTGFTGQIVVAGGAEIVPNSANAYLTESAPVNPGDVGWRASSRLLQANPDGSGVKAWAIGLDPCPPGWQGVCFTTPSIREAIAGATSGYGTATYTMPASWAMPMAGGRAPSGGGGGRYLADLIPLAGSSKGARARSKSGAVPDTAVTHAFAVALGRSQAPYTFNSVRFNWGDGFSLFRPSGTNPILQQSSAGDTAATRWHLEHLGSGVYRIRNGNPDSGTQCAYRVSGTSVLRVNTCGTSNEFKWTALSGVIYTGVFQLKNASSSNLCLDNNGVTGGTPPTNLVLKTCSSGSSAQALFLDAYNWPPP